MSCNIRNYLTSIPIILCCFCSGLIDSCVFDAWGVFATMQTGVQFNKLPLPPNQADLMIGNTVIVGLGASKQPSGHPHAWLQALMAIVFFFIGSFFCGRVTRLLSPLKRGTLAGSFFLQTILITTAAALVQRGIVPGIVSNGKEPFITIVPLPMLSFQAGMQSVTARQLGINEIPTTVLTSVYCDLGNDDKLFVGLTDNWKRNRRFGAVVWLILGAIIGGWLSRTSDGMPTALWMAAGVKLCITMAWLVWESEKIVELPK